MLQKLGWLVELSEVSDELRVQMSVNLACISDETVKDGSPLGTSSTGVWNETVLICGDLPSALFGVFGDLVDLGVFGDFGLCTMPPLEVDATFSLDTDHSPASGLLEREAEDAEAVGVLGECTAELDGEFPGSRASIALKRVVGDLGDGAPAPAVVAERHEAPGDGENASPRPAFLDRFF